MCVCVCVCVVVISSSLLFFLFFVFLFYIVVTAISVFLFLLRWYVITFSFYELRFVFRFVGLRVALWRVMIGFTLRDFQMLKTKFDEFIVTTTTRNLSFAHISNHLISCTNIINHLHTICVNYVNIINIFMCDIWYLIFDSWPLTLTFASSELSHLTVRPLTFDSLSLD